MSRPETPALTVDAIIRLKGEPDSQVVLIERRYPPHGWALPGGFVDVGETLENAAVREAKEETCLDIELEVLLGCYSNPRRDPRGHTVGMIYIARASGEPRAADDAKNIRLVNAADSTLTLAFDHRLILDDYLHFLDTGEVTPLRD